MRRLITRVLAAAAILALPALADAQQPAEKMKATAAASLEWGPIEPPGFAPGMQVATIYGDPSVADQPYTLRLKFPDGYRFPAHYHPKTENLTVLSGTFLLSMGETESENLTSYSPGDYLYLPPMMAHYGGAKGETVIQLHGVGPFEIILVKPVPAK